MCTPVDPHDIGAVSLFQFLIAALEILHHPVLPVPFGSFLIRFQKLIVLPSLHDVFQRTFVFFCILLPGGFQIFQIPRAGTMPGMADIGAVEHGLWVVLLDLLQKILYDLGAACCALPVLELLIQQFVIVCLHPQIEELCICIRVFHKQIPHSLFIIFTPDLKFPIQNMRIAVPFSVEVDLVRGVACVVRVVPEQPQQCQNQYQNQYGDGTFPTSGLFSCFHCNFSFISTISAQKRLGQWVMRPFSLWRALISSVL